MSYIESISREKRIDFLNKNYFMLGVLAINEDDYPTIGLKKKPITARNINSDEILFYVKNISTDPNLLIELDLTDELWVGFSNSSFREYPIADEIISDRYNYADKNEKEKILKEKLKNKVFLMRLRIEEHNDIAGKYFKNFYIKDIEDIDNINNKNYNNVDDLYHEEFIPIPGPKCSSKEFENKLASNENIIFPDFNIMEMSLDKILVNNFLYYDPEDNWQITSSQKCRNKAPQNIKKIKLPKNFRNNIIYKYNDNLLFISKTYNLELDHYKGTRVLNNTKIKFEKSKATSEDTDKEEQIVKHSKDIGENNGETEFLNSLYQTALSWNLYYKKEDLYNLHVSIKTSPLTIISGMSGTGKTKMAQLYAETLGLKLDKEYLIIPISPAYKEPGDILGYLNTMSGIYTPAETGLVDLLIEASKNPDDIYMVIFDEMNLSQVEHWFSPFISLLELEEKERKLVLYSEDSICHNKYNPKIEIGDNVIFVGTVNIDETTKDFSDRLLDRANVIIPDKMNFSEIKHTLEEEDTLNPDENSGSFNEIDQFHNWRVEPDKPMLYLSKDELKLLDKLHETMNNVDSQKGVSFRIVKNIAKYLKNIPSNNEGAPFIERGKAFDLQIKQRVLTKIKGHEQQYGDLIGELKPNEKKEDIKNSSIYNILTSEIAQNISDFDNSLEELARKAREMYYNGYAT